MRFFYFIFRSQTQQQMFYDGVVTLFMLNVMSSNGVNTIFVNLRLSLVSN